VPADRAIKRYLVDQSINFCILTGGLHGDVIVLADQWRPRLRVQMQGGEGVGSQPMSTDVHIT
jgi:hypothetical protein